MIFMLAGQLCLKRGINLVTAGTVPTSSEFFREFLPRILFAPYVILGIGLCGIGFLLTLYILSRFDLGVAMPLMTGVYYLLLFATTRAFLHEPVGAGQIAGVVLVVSGVYFLTLKAA